MIYSFTPPHLQQGSLEKTPITIIRWDLNDPLISGNKAEKLSWQLQLISAMSPRERPHMLSMGGPWSNHLHALSAACHQENLRLTALIRGHPPKTPSPTLRDLARWGTETHYVARGCYRQIRAKSSELFENMMNKAPPCKTETLSQQDVTPDQLKALIDSLPGLKYLLAAIPWQEQRRIVSALRQTVLQCQHFNQHLSTLLPELSLPPRTWWIPEGGNNALGIWSIAAWAKNTLEHMDKFGFPSDTWIIPVGSSATFKGILAGFSSTTLETLPRLIGVPVFNNSHYLDREISDFIERSIKRKNHQKHAEWLLWHNQDVGGFGKVPNHLSAQEKSLTEQLGVPLDRVYTLKVAYALAQYLARTSQPSPLCQLQSSIKRALSGSLGKICLLHTGGLQGNRDLV